MDQVYKRFLTYQAYTCGNWISLRNCFGSILKQCFDNIQTFILLFFMKYDVVGIEKFLNLLNKRFWYCNLTIYSQAWNMFYLKT